MRLISAFIILFATTLHAAKTNLPSASTLMVAAGSNNSIRVPSGTLGIPQAITNSVTLEDYTTNSAGIALDFTTIDRSDVSNQLRQSTARIAATRGTNSTGGDLTIWTAANGSSNLTERLRITHDGHLGIGAVGTPLYPLHVLGKIKSDFLEIGPYADQVQLQGKLTAPGARISGTNGLMLLDDTFWGSSQGFNLDFEANSGSSASKVARIQGKRTATGEDATGGDLIFSTTPLNAYELIARIWLKDNGNLGIGTNNPQALLHVAGTGRIDNLFAPTSTLAMVSIGTGRIDCIQAPDGQTYLDTYGYLYKPGYTSAVLDPNRLQLNDESGRTALQWSDRALYGDVRVGETNTEALLTWNNYLLNARTNLEMNGNNLTGANIVEGTTLHSTARRLVLGPSYADDGIWSDGTRIRFRQTDSNAILSAADGVQDDDLVTMRQLHASSGNSTITNNLSMNGFSITNAGDIKSGTLWADTVYLTNRTIMMNPPWTNSGGPGDLNCYLASDGANFFQFGVNTNNWLAKLRCGSATNNNEAVTLAQVISGASSGTVLMVSSPTGFSISPYTVTNINIGAITSGGLVGDRRINIGTNNAGWFSDGGSGLTVGQNNLCRKLSLAVGEDCQAYGKYSASFGKGNYSEGDHSFSCGRNGGAYAPGAISFNGIVNAGSDDGMALRGGVVAANSVRGFAVGSSATVTNSDAHVIAHWGYGADLGSFGTYSLALGYSGGIYMMGSNRVVIDAPLYVQYYNYGVLCSNAQYSVPVTNTLMNLLNALPKVSRDPAACSVTLLFTNGWYELTNSIDLNGFDYPIYLTGVQSNLSGTAASTNWPTVISGANLANNVLNVNYCKGMAQPRYMQIYGNTTGAFACVSATGSMFVNGRNLWLRGNGTASGSGAANTGAPRFVLTYCAFSDAQTAVTASGGNIGIVDGRVTNTVPLYGFVIANAGVVMTNTSCSMTGTTANINRSIYNIP